MDEAQWQPADADQRAADWLRGRTALPACALGIVSAYVPGTLARAVWASCEHGDADGAALALALGRAELGGHLGAALIRAFELAAGGGHLGAARWAHAQRDGEKLDAAPLCRALVSAWAGGHALVAEWLTTLGAAPAAGDEIREACWFALRAACARGDTDTARRIWAHGLSPDDLGRLEGGGLLAEASASGSEAAVLWVWGLGIGCSDIIDTLRAAYSAACLSGHINVASRLARLGLPHGDTPDVSVDTCAAGHLEAARHMVALTRGPWEKRRLEMVRVACAAGHAHVAKHFWVNALGRYAAVLLPAICAGGSVELAELLFGVNPQCVEVRDPDTLTNAALGGHVGMLRWLVRAGSPVCSHSDCLGAALSGASARGQVAVVEWLHGRLPARDVAHRAEAFSRACAAGYSATAAVLWRAGGLRVPREQCFGAAYREGRLAMAQWLHSLEGGALGAVAIDRAAWLAQRPELLTWLDAGAAAPGRAAFGRVVRADCARLPGFFREAVGPADSGELGVGGPTEVVSLLFG